MHRQPRWKAYGSYEACYDACSLSTGVPGLFVGLGLGIGSASGATLKAIALGPVFTGLGVLLAGWEVGNWIECTRYCTRMDCVSWGNYWIQYYDFEAKRFIEYTGTRECAEVITGELRQVSMAKGRSGYVWQCREGGSVPCGQ
jgi:hypothetical protein